jgi:hypothetical protein
MKKLIKRILREEIEKSDRHYRRLDIISDHVQLPYFKSMEGLTIDDKDDQLYIMKKIYGNDIRTHGRNIYDSKYDNILYFEESTGFWRKYEYEYTKLMYYENSDDFWVKYKYDDNGRKTDRKNSEGEWSTYKYEKNGTWEYTEYPSGFWENSLEDEDGNNLYYENSDDNY